MELRFLGGAREVGRSAVLVDDTLLLDYGMASTNPPSYPVGSPDPEAVVVSHGHLDHVGALPALLSGRARPPVHWTPPTREFALTLARDTLKLHGGTPHCPFTETDVARLTQVSETHGYGESFEAAGYEITLYNAGHIPGSAHVLVDDGDARLLYTGDFHVGNPERPRAPAPENGQRLVAPSTERPDADVVICESTYADVTHADRAETEERFARALRETVVGGGTVVVPAFAIGRTQEVLLACAANDVECYVDGMGKRVTRMLNSHPEFVRDADALQRATSRARFVTGRDGQRKRIAAQNTVVVTTSGMLSGGPAMTYVPEIRGHPTNLVAFVGYQVEGTPGRELLETGSAELDGRVMPVAARTDLFEFSAHADRPGLESFLADYEDARVLCNHGDRCAWFAGELREAGYDASAPELGETVTV
ncbi:MBL fold metallo-hydrolase [Halomarina litorea]|uniref:MBL fold metallo-hydrolase n=1 Tax=Halomarina litorea TaxID=2961595 RepID=UPI0020C577A4|nr:MBL fold metallo-hydrolase [Halomarina sp. BCD28]